MWKIFPQRANYTQDRFRRNLNWFMTPLLRNLAYIFTVSLSLVQFLLNFLWLAQPVCHGANHLKSLLSRVVVFRLLIVYTLSKKDFIHVPPMYVYWLTNYTYVLQYYYIVYIKHIYSGIFKRLRYKLEFHCLLPIFHWIIFHPSSQSPGLTYHCQCSVPLSSRGHPCASGRENRFLSHARRAFIL